MVENTREFSKTSKEVKIRDYVGGPRGPPRRWARDQVALSKDQIYIHLGVAFARAALAVFLGVLSGGPRHDAACLTACLSGSMAAANLRRRRFLRLMLDAPVRKLGSHLQAAEYTRGYATNPNPNGRWRADGDSAPQKHLPRARRTNWAPSPRLQLQPRHAAARTRAASVPPVVAAAIVDLLASTPSSVTVPSVLRVTAFGGGLC